MASQPDRLFVDIQPLCQDGALHEHPALIKLSSQHPGELALQAQFLLLQDRGSKGDKLLHQFADLTEPGLQVTGKVAPLFTPPLHQVIQRLLQRFLQKGPEELFEMCIRDRSR